MQCSSSCSLPCSPQNELSLRRQEERHETRGVEMPSLTPQPSKHPPWLSTRQLASYSRQRISCSWSFALLAPTGCGRGEAACDSTCGGTTRTPSRKTATGRLLRLQHLCLSGPDHHQPQPRRAKAKELKPGSRESLNAQLRWGTGLQRGVL